MDVPATMFLISLAKRALRRMLRLFSSHWEHGVRNTVNRTVVSCFQNIGGTLNLLETRKTKEKGKNRRFFVK